MDGTITAQVAAVGGLACVVWIAISALLGRGSNREGEPGQEPTKRTRLVGTFTARDSRGDVNTLSLYQQYLDAGTRNDPDAERKGTKHIMTADGRQVTKIGTRKYRIMGSPEILTSDDPDAP